MDSNISNVLLNLPYIHEDKQLHYYKDPSKKAFYPLRMTHIIILAECHSHSNVVKKRHWGKDRLTRE